MPPKPSSKRARGLFALLLLALSGWAFRVHASPAGLQLRSPAAKQLDSLPGSIVTTSVVVACPEGGGGEYTDVLDLPPGCQRVAPMEGAFNLPAGGQMVRVIAVRLPGNMPSGSFSLHYSVRPASEGAKPLPQADATLNFTVKVATVDKMELVVDPLTSPVLAGDTYPVTLHVTNRGNNTVAAQIAARSSLNFDLHLNPSAFSLAAGATRDLVCMVKTDKAYTRHGSHAVTFTLTAAARDKGKDITASQASVAEIIPLESGNRQDTLHRLPIQIRMMGVAESNHGVQMQGEISGEGSLDEAGKHMISFLFRGPDIQNATLFAERAEYGMSYRGENLSVDIGDRIYELSPLLEKGSLGRGAGLGWHQDGMAAGAFTMSSLYRQHNIDEAGAYLRQDITEDVSLQGSVMRKSGFDPLTPWRLPQDLASLEARYHIGKELDLRIEGGLSQTDGGRDDNAMRVEARGELPGGFRYAIERIHAGPDFDGYYSGNDLTCISLSEDFTQRFRMRAALNRYAGNPSLNDVLSSVVNSEDSWNAAATYAFDDARNTEASLEYDHVRRADILLPAAYHFTEQFARAGLGHNFGQFNAQVYLDNGTLDNYLTRQSGPFTRYSASLTWRPTDSQAYSCFANYGPSPYTGTWDKTMNAGVSAHWQISQKMSATVSVSSNQYNGLTGTEQDQAMFTLRKEFKDKSSVSLIGRWARGIITSAFSGVTNDSAVFVSYTVPLSVPVSRKTSIGALEGRLIDTTPGAGGKGLARAVIQVGQQYAATDENGRFAFPALTPGPCELLVMPDSLGPRMTMVTGLPMQLTVKPADTTFAELHATAACSIAIKVQRYVFADGDAMHTSGALKADGGQDNVAVEIENGHDSWRAITDRQGCATFERLLPGEWKVRLVGNELPPLCSLEHPERSLTLKPGKNQEVAVRVLPMKRTLKLLDQGAIR